MNREDRSHWPEIADDPVMQRPNNAAPEGWPTAWTGALDETAYLDTELDDGEGTLGPDDLDMCPAIRAMWPGTRRDFRTVRILDDQGSRVAVFSLIIIDGDLYELRLLRERKGLPPNPRDGIHGTLFRAGRVVGRYGPVPGEQELIKDLYGSQGVKGLRPSIVHPVVPRSPQPGRGLKWKFPGFAVYSDKLAPVLVRAREAGIREISTAQLQAALALN